MFIQDPPRPTDLFEADRALQAELKRRLPAPMHAAMLPRWQAVGRDTAGRLAELSERAEA